MEESCGEKTGALEKKGEGWEGWRKTLECFPNTGRAAHWGIPWDSQVKTECVCPFPGG